MPLSGAMLPKIKCSWGKVGIWLRMLSAILKWIIQDAISAPFCNEINDCLQEEYAGGNFLQEVSPKPLSRNLNEYSCGAGAPHGR